MHGHSKKFEGVQLHLGAGGSDGGAPWVAPESIGEDLDRMGERRFVREGKVWERKSVGG